MCYTPAEDANRERGQLLVNKAAFFLFSAVIIAVSNSEIFKTFLSLVLAFRNAEKAAILNPRQQVCAQEKKKV